MTVLHKSGVYFPWYKSNLIINFCNCKNNVTNNEKKNHNLFFLDSFQRKSGCKVE